MKLKLLAFTLFIGMISFAGFSFTTTDLCQNSNLEYVAYADADATVQGVVDSIIVEDNLVDAIVSAPSYETLGTETFDEAIILNFSEEVRSIKATDGVTIKNHTQPQSRAIIPKNCTDMNAPRRGHYKQIV